MICDTTNESSTATICKTNSESTTPVCVPTCDVTTQYLTPQTSPQQSENNILPSHATNTTPSSSDKKSMTHESPKTPDYEEVIITIDPGMTKAVNESIIVFV